MALKNAFGGLALDDTLKGLIEKFRNNKEPLFVTNGEDPFVVESRPRPDPAITVWARAITSTTTAGIIVPANNSRVALSIYNASTAAVLYVLASKDPFQVVTATFCTIPLGIGDYWELPQGINGCYKGPIQGVWASASGTCVVTEYS